MAGHSGKLHYLGKQEQFLLHVSSNPFSFSLNWTFGSLIDSRFYIILMSFDFNEQFGAKSFGSSGYIEHLVQYLVPPCWFGTPEAEPPDVPAGFPSWCKHVPESVRGMVSQCPNVTSSIGGWTSMGEFLRVSPNIPIGFAHVGGCCSCCTYMTNKRKKERFPKMRCLVRQGAVDRFPNMKQTES